MIKAPSENNSQVSMYGRRITCNNCLEVGHNKTTRDKELVPKTPRPRKTPDEEMDIDAINKTPTSNNLNLNTQEYVADHMTEDVVEDVVADPFVEVGIIDKAVVAEDDVAVSSLSKKIKRKKEDK
uniref:Splicing factor n=1 Tax=Tanacetum cinerariifolium TaxID=118510 RepID=A0A6L2LV26_TANCI|nr:splicing factor [Tanacetum cinerariifolium]